MENPYLDLFSLIKNQVEIGFYLFFIDKKDFLDKCYKLLYTVIEERNTLKIIIKNGSAVPIYEQIKNAIRDEILKGNIKAGEKLPSVRNLARELSISILTVKKAYDELESEGFIESRQGLGTFVGKEDPNLRLEEKQKKLEEALIEALRISKDIEMKKSDLFELLEYLYEGDFND